MKLRRKLDEYGVIIQHELSLDVFGGGGKGGGGKTVYVPQPYAQAVATPQAADLQATQEFASTTEEEAKKLKEANKSGAKSLQIPLTGTQSTTDATKAVGTV